MTAAHGIGAAAVWLAAALLFAPSIVRALCRRWGLVKPNFQNVPIPSSIGLTFLLAACPAYGLLLAFGAAGVFPVGLPAAFLFCTLGFGLLGLLDDKWGSRSVGGFRGHIKALLRGKPTTGSAKLVGGGLVALGAAWLVNRGGGHEAEGLMQWAAWLVDAAVIALGANALNLLDVRPGRALFGFAVLAGVAAIGAVMAGASFQNAPAVSKTVAPGFLLLVPLVFAALREVVPDARARVMLGDTGSNLLGATASLACVCVLPLWGRVLLLTCLLALNGLAEQVSLSALITKTPFLRAIDRRLGVR